MAGRIPQSFIDELLVRVDIVSVIDTRIQLKKSGREYSACCPFHDEKTPSFTVSPDKQFYHCFGCGAHGSALGFVMDYEHLGFVEAVEELAAGVGMAVPREEGQAPVESGHKALYEVMEKATRFYCQQLRQHPEASRARDYLKSRGLSGEIAAQFELGFAPPGWNNLATALVADGVTETQLLQCGLLVKNDSGGSYDRFRDRILFPIRDSRGRAIAFGGRLLEGDDGPKYLNSSETPIFHKGHELYGLYQARKAERKLERLLVVEGYMDVVSLAQFGVRNVVATLGTATTREHLERLFRVVPQVVCCFDGDRAGRQAAWRALENALPVLSAGRQINFMFLPDGEDPDTLVREEGKEKFAARIGDAAAFSDYFFGELAQAVDVKTMDGRRSLKEKARPLLDKLPDGEFRRMMTTRLGEITLDPAVMMGPGDQLTASGHQRRHRPRHRPLAGSNSTPSAVRQAIQLLLHQPALVALIKDEAIFQGINQPGISLLCELVELLRVNPHLKCGAIIEHWRDAKEGQHLAKLASQAVMVPEDGLEEEFRDLVAKLAAERDEQTLDGLLAKSRLDSLTEDEKSQLQQALASRGESGA